MLQGYFKTTCDSHGYFRRGFNKYNVNCKKKLSGKNWKHKGGLAEDSFNYHANVQ